jgi:polyphosphate kinase
VPALCRLSRAALRGLTALATTGIGLTARPPSPLRCAELALGAAIRVNDALLNWANAALGDIENSRPGSLDARGTGDNDDMSVGEVSFQQSRDEMGTGRAADHGGLELADDLPADRYIEREGSWLRFNQRVLELAQDDTVPLLERVRFMAIFASNLDEFFMVRVAGRMRRMATGLPVEGVTTEMAPDQVLENTLETARELSLEHAEYFNSAIRPLLANEGIEILRWKELSAQEQDQLQQLFRDRIYPVLTPLVVDPAHPWPYISGLSLSLAVMVADPETGATMFARVKVPPLLPRFITVGTHRFVPLEDVIAAHLPELFTGLDILEHHVFRVTRTRELEVDEDVTEDLMQSLERELLRRRFEPAVRLEVEETISPEVLEKLVTELDVDRRSVYHLPGPLDLTGLNAIADLSIRRLKYPAFVPSESAFPHDADVFATLDRRDVLVHHPYDSFTATVERLTVEAAADPRVLAIKQTLYRTSDSSPIVEALIDAAEAGKQVVVVVELKARFDERANILWARKLEEAGCHVVYGFVDLKTHCKMALVVREEPDGSLRRYCHIGTGNYNSSTARLYEDYGLLTSDPEVGGDATDLFNVLTGYSRNTEYHRFLVAPYALRTGLLERIERQIAWQREGRPARIQLKCNAIVDEAVIDALYRASMAGVPVDLWVRGICSLRPGLPGLSETIQVRSILGRFLEHSRIYAFGPAEDDEGEVWIGSADLMHRNLDRRVECLCRVKRSDQQQELRQLIELAMDDATSSWWLAGDGTWTRHHLDAEGKPLRDLQQYLLSRRGHPTDG